VSGWDITAFADALRQIGVSADGAPFRTEIWGETYLLMLIAAYGGRLMDTTTEPTTFYLDDPANIAAAQQALDLGRAGLIHYQALGTNYGGLFSISDSTPIYSAYLTTLGYRLRQRDGGDPYRAVAFPRGSRYTPLSYQPGVGYISAESAYPEACYRWLRYIAGQPALWDGMPARRSLLDDAAFGFTAGDDLLALYQAFDAALQSPDALIFDALFHGSYAADSYANYPAKAISGMGRLWMLRAFDSYVLNATDLTAAMTAAQGYTNDYALCIAAIESPVQPLAELDAEAQRAYFDHFTNCAVTIDPSLESYFRQ
ncbi:MAG: hypothetical protein K8I60_06905, partial [Anaerolineae bacterium]|nr:hypothetical protein [Anaerolineae bacterium]